jgi:UDP-N-acetylglucosamine 2-epimerase
MIGNSSSALIEAPAARLAAVNLGDRQLGRVRGENVIDATGDPDSIRSALRFSASSGFRARLAKMSNPYGDGGAASRVVEALENVELQGLRRKPPVLTSGT